MARTTSCEYAAGFPLIKTVATGDSVHTLPLASISDVEIVPIMGVIGDLTEVCDPKQSGLLLSEIPAIGLGVGVGVGVGVGAVGAGVGVGVGAGHEDVAGVMLVPLTAVTG